MCIVLYGANSVRFFYLGSSPFHFIWFSSLFGSVFGGGGGGGGGTLMTTQKKKKKKDIHSPKSDLGEK